MSALWASIPPEVLVGLIVGGVSGGAYLIRKWFLLKLDQSKAEYENKLKDAEAARDIKLLELQNKLDETQSGKELSKLLVTELNETRKEDIQQRMAQQAAYDKRDEQHDKRMAEITEVFRGIQSNTAATLELLKEHKESDEIMGIKQERIIAQNDKTHEKIADLTSTVDALAIKIDSLAVGRVADKKILDEIREDLQGIVKKLAEIEAPKTVEVSMTSAVVTNATNEANETVNETSKELNQKDETP